MVTVGVFEFCGMRCQPLRRALGLLTFKFGVSMKIDKVEYPEEVKAFIFSLTDEIKSRIEDPEFDLSGISIESKEEFFLFTVFTWVKNTNEILTGLDIVIHDIESLPSNYHSLLYGSIVSRFELLVRMFFHEFYRLRELNATILGALVRQDVIDKATSSQIKQTFHDTFEQAIKIRNKMVHDKIEWESKDHQVLTMYDLMTNVGFEMRHLDSGNPLDVGVVLGKRVNEFLPLMLASTDAARDFVGTFSRTICSVHKEFFELQK
ncbi:TPA: hypothetical protein AB5E10_003346 [Vibrio cholerae]